MNSNSETDNFLKIFLSVIEFGTNSQREMIEHQLKRFNLSFCELLDEKAHELFHLCFLQRCCQCGPIDVLPNVMSIRKDQFSKLFLLDTTKRIASHKQKGRVCKCCYVANMSICVDDLDFSLANTILVHSCRELLWHCCLDAKKKTFEEFLNENKHAIFHMWISDRSCRSCRNGELLKVKSTIDITDWHFLFEKKSSDVDPSCYYANQCITSSNLDSKLSYILLQELSGEIEISRKLREFRNTICHYPSSRMKVHEFEKMWSTIETILLQLSTIYGGNTDVKKKLHILKTRGYEGEIIRALLERTKKEHELDEKLNEVCIVVHNIEEQLCSMEEIKEHLENIQTEFYQRQHVYVERSSNEIQSRMIQMKGHVIANKFELDRSSVKFQHEKNPEERETASKKFMQAVRNKFRKRTTKSKTKTKLRHVDPIKIRLRLDDPTATTFEKASKSNAEKHPEGDVIYSRSVSDKHPDEEILYRRSYLEEVEQVEEIEPDPDDSFSCGTCKATYTSIQSFQRHKLTHKAKRKEVVEIKLTIEGLQDDLVEKYIELRIPKGISLKEAKILDEAPGSLIIWTQMSTRVFKAKDLFFTAIEKLLKEIFSKSPVDTNRDIKVTIDIAIADDVSDYENDEDDIFRCGVCSKEFCVLEAFQRHKLRFCRQRTSVSDYCDVIEYTMDAFPRLQDHQHNLNACVQMDEIRDELLTFLAQYPCALYYCGNVDKQMNTFYQRNLQKTQKITLSPELNTADGTSMPNVILCVLRGEYGHLSSIDTACLQKLKKELPDHWIDKTLFMVTASSFSGSLRNFNTLSYEISKELSIDMKTLTFRIFKDKDEDIFERMSLYFEQELVEKRYDLSRHLHSLGSDITLALHHTLSASFTEKLKRILLAGPLEVRLFDILKSASRSYEWKEESFTRNKDTVTRATDKIARFACEKLGQEIVETLIHHFTREMLSSNQDFSIAIFRYINLNDIGSTVLKDLLIILFNIFFGPVGWLISAIIILFSGTEINSVSFRDEVASKMKTQIHQQKDQILQEVIQKFRADVIPRLKAIKIELEHSDIDLRRLFSKKEHLIRKMSVEHEFKTIAAKHELIRNFKFEDDTLKIYASGNEEHYEDVREFVYAYFRPDVKTEVYMDQNTEGI